MIFKFCPLCGEKLLIREVGDEGLIPFCGACSVPFFSFSYPCVICLVINQDKRVALLRQGYVSDGFVCVAGYIRQGETAEQAAKREVEEEIGLAVLSAEYIKSYYYEKHDNLMLGFVCKVENSDFKISGEVDFAGWFTFEEARELLQKSKVAGKLLQDFLLRENFR